MSDERKGLPSASAVPQIAACAPSFRMQRHLVGWKSAEDQAWAQAGDRIHLWLSDGPRAATLTPEELEVAENCLRHRNRLALMIFGSESDPTATVLKERRLWFPAKGDPRCSAKCDYTEIRGDTALVVDYKTNRGDHEDSDSNLQLRTILVTVKANHRHLKRICVALIQPLLGEPSFCDYDEADMARSQKQLLEILNAADRDDIEPTAGKHCRFCKAKLVCAAVHQNMDLIRVAGDLQAGSDLARLLDLSRPVKSMIKDAEEYAKELLSQDSTAVPGWKLKQNAGIRQVTDNQAVYEAMLAAGAVDRDTFIKACISIGIGASEKAIQEFKKVGPTEAKRMFRELSAAHVKQEPKAPSLEKA